MIRRPRRSTPASLVALVVLAAAAAVVVAVVQSLLGRTPFVSLPDLLAVTATQRWDSPATVAVAVVVGVIGLVLLTAALRPGRPTVLPLGAATGPDGRPGARTGVRRRSLATDLAATAATVPGVTGATVSVARNRITVRARVAAADPAAVSAQVRDRLGARVVEIGPATRPRLRVRTRPDPLTPPTLPEEHPWPAPTDRPVSTAPCWP